MSRHTARRAGARLGYCAAAVAAAVALTAVAGCGQSKAADEQTARSSIGPIPAGGPPGPPANFVAPAGRIPPKAK